jgi:virginiamycin B lyase
MTAAGAITNTYPLTGGSLPAGITVGLDGALWFAEPGSSKIGRLQ